MEGDQDARNWGGSQEISMESQKRLQKEKIKAKWCAAGMENLATSCALSVKSAPFIQLLSVGKNIGKEETDGKKPHSRYGFFGVE